MHQYLFSNPESNDVVPQAVIDKSNLAICNLSLMLKAQLMTLSVWDDPKLELSELFEKTLPLSYYLSLSRKRNEPRLHYYKLKVLQVGFFLVKINMHRV